MSGPRYTTDGMWFRPFYSHPTKKATFRAALVLTISPRAGLSLEALVRGPHSTLHGWPLPFPCGFLFFNFIFYKNIFSFSKSREIYPGRPAAGRSGPASGWPPGSRGRAQIFRENFCRKAPAALQRGDQVPAAR